MVLILTVGDLDSGDLGSVIAGGREEGGMNKAESGPEKSVMSL